VVLGRPVQADQQGEVVPDARQVVEVPLEQQAVGAHRDGPRIPVRQLGDLAEPRVRQRFTAPQKELRP
jgi:hypothetical protein